MKTNHAVFSILAGLSLTWSTLSGQIQDNIYLQNTTINEEKVNYPERKDTSVTHYPLADKKFGIGFNPVRTIAYIGYELNLRGAFSFFSIDRNAEIAFPIQYLYGSERNIPYRFFYSEVTYRRFLNKEQKGFYLSGGIRYAYIEGERILEPEISGSPHIYTGEVFKGDKIGIYAGIGFRHFSAKGFYWGTNIIFGDYFGSDTPFIETSEDFVTNIIFGCELFQIGYAF